MAKNMKTYLLTFDMDNEEEKQAYTKLVENKEVNGVNMRSFIMNAIKEKFARCDETIAVEVNKRELYDFLGKKM